jgi:hypothetical protein
MRRVIVAVVAALVLPACAAMPSAGPVTRVETDEDLSETTVRYSPARPVAGASPEQVVRGYLDAMLAFPASTGTAKSFLTPEAAKAWRSLEGVRVYAGPEVGAAASPRRPATADDAPETAAVRVGLTELARLDVQGHYTRGVGVSRTDFRLQRVDGEWRITNPQDGLLVDEKYFDDYFRPLDIFVFDRPGQRLVPDPVYLAVGDQLPTALVTSLARGTGTAGVPLRTYVPPLSTLRPSVPVDEDGVADVQFSTGFSSVAEPARTRLAGQIVRTLRQVPWIKGVRITGASVPLEQDGDPVRSMGTGASFAADPTPGHVYALADDRVVEIDQDEVGPISGAWGKDARGARSVAVDDEGVAAVLPGRAEVRVTTRAGASARTVRGDAFLPPSYDADGVLWLVDRADERTRVRVLAGESPRRLDVGRLADLRVETFAVSPDATRYAVTARQGGSTSLWTGAVVRDAKGTIVGLGSPARLVTGVPQPRSAVWTSGTELGHLGSGPDGTQVYTTRIDGSVTTGGSGDDDALLADVDARALAIGGADRPPRYVTDDAGGLWFLSPDGLWRRLEKSGVSGLTTGL